MTPEENVPCDIDENEDDRKPAALPSSLRMPSHRDRGHSYSSNVRKSSVTDRSLLVPTTDCFYGNSASLRPKEVLRNDDSLSQLHNQASETISGCNDGENQQKSVYFVVASLE
jgi:hypothetical protein